MHDVRISTCKLVTYSDEIWKQVAARVNNLYQKKFKILFKVSFPWHHRYGRFFDESLNNFYNLLAIDNKRQTLQESGCKGK